MNDEPLKRVSALRKLHPVHAGRVADRVREEHAAPLRVRLYDDSRDLDQLTVAEPLADGVTKILVAIADVDALVNAVRRLPGGTDVSVEPSRIVSDDARRAVNFQTIALWLVAAIAVIGGSLVVFQLTVRVTTPTDAERGSLRAIGWLDRTWLGVAMIQAAAMAVVAVPLAVATMLVVSRQFPIGTLATFEPRRGYRLDAPVAVLGSLTMTAIAGLAGVLVAVRDRIGSRRREVEDAARYRRGC